jgi:hypothetical protein
MPFFSRRFFATFLGVPKHHKKFPEKPRKFQKNCTSLPTSLPFLFFLPPLAGGGCRSRSWLAPLASAGPALLRLVPFAILPPFLLLFPSSLLCSSFLLFFAFFFSFLLLFYPLLPSFLRRFWGAVFFRRFFFKCTSLLKKGCGGQAGFFFNQ